MLKIVYRGVIVLSLFATAAICLPLIVAPMIEMFLNKVRLSRPYKVQETTNAVHKRLFVADLHADPLLWRRNLLRRSSYGHVDIPRLVEGNVALQVFAAATKIPVGINFDRNPARGDLLLALTAVQAWPPRTWFSLLQRALYQAQKLRKFASQAPDRLLLISDALDLDRLITRREKELELVGALLALEGAHALEGDISNLDLLYDAGFRMIGLAHFFDNEAGGSAHGLQKGGLTPFGRDLVRQCEERKLLLDLAHASGRLIDDVLAIGARTPVIVSHTGVRGVCDNQRNISDDHVRGIAATGGVIGIALFEATVCGATIADTARTMRYVADLVGVDHVAIGSDYDGAITAPMDTGGMALLTENLLQQGFTVDEVAKIMGRNVLRVLRAVLIGQDS
jgi:microsomal dipeptidase-like Zn-dependent dipeptidase